MHLPKKMLGDKMLLFERHPFQLWISYRVPSSKVTCGTVSKIMKCPINLREYHDDMERLRVSSNNNDPSRRLKYTK